MVGGTVWGEAETGHGARGQPFPRSLQKGHGPTRTATSGLQNCHRMNLSRFEPQTAKESQYTYSGKLMNLIFIVRAALTPA